MATSQLLHKGRRWASRRLREVLPHNGHYRPVGVHASSQALAAVPRSGATYVEIYAPETSYLEISEALYHHTCDYGGLHAKPIRTEDTSASFLLALEHGRLLADNSQSVAVISADNQLVGDVSFQYDARQSDVTRPEHNNVFRLRWFSEPVRVRGTVFSLLSGGGAASGNYYHWLTDSLPRLHLLKEAGLWDSVDYFLVYDRRRFVLDSLLAMGIREEQLLDVSTHQHLLADRLLVTSHVRRPTHTPEWACSFLRQELLPAAAPDTFSPYIYLSRRDAPARHVLNEAAVEDFLRPYGFETHVLGHYTLAQQIALFAGARMVIAPTGAGLTNLLFAPPGTPVVELFPKHFTVIEYPELCYRLGLPHQFLVAEAANGALHSRRQGWQEDLTVDLAALAECLANAGPAAPAARPAARPVHSAASPY
ncbi:glycosyltransferase family 61 protein [Hymenobacter aquaticus]|uniref:Glycosyltransferase family 61 protein n=1 Tax=Hymenobacter aquaticus TaxID=1867101 RepID=A0A4Z0Q7H6_9BACT|nr:glycosyltransferase family 61 protein [Hymenobacter aquaticus]TGE25103.1 glycosyltransferase family 61 protein [Hymenobacter aquaticus]